MAKKLDLAAAIGGAVSELGAGREQIEYLPLEHLHADAKNFYSLDGIEELAGNIELCGLQQPILVRRDGDDYTIVSGHRRCAALRLLVGDGKEQFASVPCLVEHGEVSPALREFRLILANLDTRKMTAADISMQADRLEELAYELEQEGFKIEGRKRAWAAKLLGISTSKRGRLSYIRDHLAPEFSEPWEKGKLPEATAYELAHFTPEFQQRLARVFKGGKGLPPSEKLARLRTKVEVSAAYDPAFCCPDGTACPHGDAFLRRDAVADSWETLCKGETCCLKCDRATRSYSPCARMCARAKKIREEKNAKEKAKSDAQAKRTREKNFLELQANCARLVRAADAAGLPDNAKANDGWYADGGHAVSLLRRYARGEFKPDESPYFPSFDPKQCRNLKKCAETLHCSTDYLLGLTDDLNPVPSLGTEPEWRTLDAEHWPAEGALVVLSYETGLGGSSYLVARCAGGPEEDYPFISTDAGTTVNDIVESQCDRWMPLAECKRGAATKMNGEDEHEE